MKNNKKLNIFLVLLIISISFFLLLAFSLDNDYFWHISAGKYMFNKGVLKYDVFSWYLKDKYWMSHEWLFEIIIYGLRKIFGSIHTIIYCFSTLVSLLLILFFTNKKNMIKNIPFTLIYLLLFSILSLGFIQVRPHMISNIFVALTIYFLYDLYNNKDSKKIYFLPVITIFWANIHGGSSNLSYIFCFIFLICGLFSFKYKKIESNRVSKIQLKKYLLVMFLCMISICINIHGFKMFLYPYSNMLDTTMLNNISEWRNTSLSDPYHYIYYIFLLFTLFTMLFSDKKINFIDFILFGFVSYLGLKSIRFWLYSPIIMNYIIFNYVKDRKLEKGTYMVLGTIIIFLFSIYICNIKGINTIKYKINLNKDIINLIKKENPKRLYNMYDYGGELIYNDIDVFIDGRADLYTNYNYKDYLNISNLQGDYIKVIDKYDFDYFLVSSKYPISTYLKYSDEYDVLYKNKDILLYKKIVN